MISVELEAPAEPLNGFAVCLDAQLAEPHKHVPKEGARIAWGQPERLLNVPLDLLAPTRLIFAEADEPVCIGKIAVERQ